MRSWRKTFGKSPPPFRPETRAQGRIADQPANGGYHPPHILRWNEEAGLVVEDDFAGAVDVKTDHGLAGDQGLGQRPRKPFAKARVDYDVHSGEKSGDLIGWNQAGKAKMVGQPGRGDLPLQGGAEHAVAEKQKPRLRPGANQLRRGANHIAVPLEVEQPGDLANDNVFRPIAQLRRMASRRRAESKSESTSMPL